MNKSLKESAVTAVIATAQAKNSQISSAGYGTKDLIVNTNLAKTRRNGVVDPAKVAAMTQTKLYGSLYQIASDGPPPEKLTATDFVRECLTPVNFSEAAEAVLRLLVNFPQRQTTKDAIIASDTAADLVKFGIGLVPLFEACTELRREATKDHPWPPPSGEILNRAKEQHARLTRLLERLSAPDVPKLAAPSKIKPELPVWRQTGQWKDWNENVRADFVNHHKTWDRRIFTHVAHIYGITVEEFNDEVEKRSKKLDVQV